MSKKLVIIFGPSAVGKMTVGFELAKLTGLKLFHNHMAIELALSFFEYGTPQFGRLVLDFRHRIFEEVAHSELPGLIFTFVWALNLPAEKRYIDDLCDIFRAVDGDCYFAELEADVEERVRRNRSEFRLAQKPSKQDVARSEQYLLEQEVVYQLNSQGDFFYPDQHVKINNTHLSAADTAAQIAERFEL